MFLRINSLLSKYIQWLPIFLEQSLLLVEYFLYRICIIQIDILIATMDENNNSRGKLRMYFELNFIFVF